jgi:hypothetical protein
VDIKECGASLCAGRDHGTSVYFIHLEFIGPTDCLHAKLKSEYEGASLMFLCFRFVQRAKARHCPVAMSEMMFSSPSPGILMIGAELLSHPPHQRTQMHWDAGQTCYLMRQGAIVVPFLYVRGNVAFSAYSAGCDMKAQCTV